MPTKEQVLESLKAVLAPGEHNQKLLEIAGLLKDFLETADFKKLRADSERYLVEGRHVKVTVYAQGGVPKYEIQVT